MAVLFTPHFIQFFDNNGDPLSNGKLYAYSAGTTTPKATYTTEEATVENAHPIVLDSSGRATVFIEGSYRFDLFDENDVLIKSTDDVTSFTTLNESGDPFFQSFSGDGSQTVFTLSESLGDDSKDIMVYVNNESGDIGYDIQNPSAYTLSGTALTFNSAPPNGTDNIYVFAPTKLLGAASAAAAAAAASEAAAAASAASAAAAGLVITSTTSNTIGTGTLTFTVSSSLSISPGQWLIISSDANPATNYMSGQITSYSGTNLEVDITRAFGSGTLADWTMKLSGVEGAVGPQGPPGSISNVGSQPSATITTSDKLIFADVDDSDNSKNDTVQGLLDLVTTGFPRGYKYGGVLSNSSGDSNHDIDVTAGAFRDAADAADISLSAITKRIDATWSAGTGNGGRASSVSLSSNTWYHVFAIIVGGNADVGFDTSITASNLVTDHSATAYRYLGSVRTNGSSNITAFNQYGNRFDWVDPPLSYSGSQNTTAGTRTMTVPTGLSVKALLTVAGTDGHSIYVSSLNQSNEAPNTTAAPLTTYDDNVANRGANPIDVMTNTSGQVRTRSTGSTSTLRIVTRGWEVTEWI